MEFVNKGKLCTLHLYDYQTKFISNLFMSTENVRRFKKYLTTTYFLCKVSQKCYYKQLKKSCKFYRIGKYLSPRKHNISQQRHSSRSHHPTANITKK